MKKRSESKRASRVQTQSGRRTFGDSKHRQTRMVTFAAAQRRKRAKRVRAKRRRLNMQARRKGA